MFCYLYAFFTFLAHMLLHGQPSWSISHAWLPLKNRSVKSDGTLNLWAYSDRWYWFLQIVTAICSLSAFCVPVISLPLRQEECSQALGESVATLKREKFHSVNVCCWGLKMKKKVAHINFKLLWLYLKSKNGEWAELGWLGIQKINAAITLRQNLH